MFRAFHLYTANLPVAFRFKDTIVNAKYGGHTEAVRRLLGQLPISAQSYSGSPYLDLSLFSYDDKWVSVMERPKTCGDHPIRYVACPRDGPCLGLVHKTFVYLAHCEGEGWLLAYMSLSLIWLSLFLHSDVACCDAARCLLRTIVTHASIDSLLLPRLSWVGRIMFFGATLPWWKVARGHTPKVSRVKPTHKHSPNTHRIMRQHTCKAISHGNRGILRKATHFTFHFSS